MGVPRAVSDLQSVESGNLTMEEFLVNNPRFTESEASSLSRKQRKKVKARTDATAGLTQTSSLGAGSPQTSRASVLGV